MGMRLISATSSEAGFTLLELIVGLTIGSILLTAVYTTFVGISHTQRRIEEVLDATASWRYLTEVVRGDLAQIASGSPFTGNTAGFETELIDASGGPPLPLKYRMDELLVIRTVGESTLTIEFPQGAQQPVFRYRTDKQWRDSSKVIPGGLEINVATIRGQKSRIFALEFDPQAARLPEG